MLKIVTVCGNGIGSSLMLKMKIEEICKENDIPAQVESSDFNSAKGISCDLIITVKEIAAEFSNTNLRVGIVRSYINKKKISEDVLDLLKEVSMEKK